MQYPDFTSHYVRQHVVAHYVPDGTLSVPTFIRVIKGRFTHSIGRVMKVSVTPNKYSRGTDSYYVHVAFETGGRTYKFFVSDSMYGADIMLERSASSDAFLKRVDENDNKAIPKLTDRYGTEVVVGMMMVVHTHHGLKVGTVKSITPKGSIRFKDFDNSKTEFSKAIFPGSDSLEIMALQKDFMDQMMLRKLARL